MPHIFSLSTRKNVSGQIYAPATFTTLPQGKMPLVCIIQGTGWGPGPTWTLRPCWEVNHNFLISNFCRVLYVVCFLPGNSPATECIIHLLAYEDGTDRVFRNVSI